MNKRMFNMVCALCSIIILFVLIGFATLFNGDIVTDNVQPIDEIEDIIIPEPKTIEQAVINLGTFKISAYCHCSKCCGKSDGITATGAKVQANRTIAVDPRIIPLGSQVMIDGKVYVAEDTGGGIKGNRIDMYFPTHQEALNWGIQYRDVSLIKQ